MKDFIITIDGPCGAGKTTIAKALAKKFDAIYLDTGGIYRMLAYAIDNGIDLDDTNARYDKDKNLCLSARGRALGDEIRTQHISDLSSKISTEKDIRDRVTAICRKIVKGHAIIAEGRDTGTVLFPDADAKFYLTAKTSSRAARRLDQSPGQYDTVEDSVKAIVDRDRRDMSRELAPLPSIQEAERQHMTIVDSTEMSLQDTIDHIAMLAENAIVTKHST